MAQVQLTVSHSLDAFVEAADGITFREVTGLLPLGPPAPTGVPEPSTILLFSAGLLGLAAFGCRRKAKALVMKRGLYVSVALLSSIAVVGADSAVATPLPRHNT